MNTQYQLVREWRNDTVSEERYPMYMFYLNSECRAVVLKVTEEQAKVAYEVFKKEYVYADRKLICSEKIVDLSGVLHKVECELCVSKVFNHSLVAKDIFRMEDYFQLYIWDGTKIIKDASGFGGPSEDVLNEFLKEYNKHIEFVKSYNPNTEKEILITENVENHA